MEDSDDEMERDLRTYHRAFVGVDDALIARYGSAAHTVDRMHELMRSACREGRPEIVFALADGGVSVNAMDRSGRSPLFHAALYGRTSVVEVLLASGADPDLTRYLGIRPLVLAIARGDPDLISLLRNHGSGIFGGGCFEPNASDYVHGFDDRNRDGDPARVLRALIGDL